MPGCCGRCAAWGSVCSSCCWPACSPSAPSKRRHNQSHNQPERVRRAAPLRRSRHLGLAPLQRRTPRSRSGFHSAPVAGATVRSGKPDFHSERTAAPPLGPGAAGAGNGSQRVRASPESPRPAQTVYADERRPVRPTQTMPDSPAWGSASPARKRSLVQSSTPASTNLFQLSASLPCAARAPWGREETGR